MSQLRGSSWPQLRNIWISTLRFLNMSLERSFNIHFCFNGKLVNIGHFRPTLASWLPKEAYYGLIWQPGALQKISVGAHDLAWHILVLWGGSGLLNHSFYQLCCSKHSIIDSPNPKVSLKWPLLANFSWKQISI